MACSSRALVCANDPGNARGPEVSSLEVGLIRAKVRRVTARRRRVSRQSDSQRRGDRVRNLVLDREDVRPLAVVALGPEMKAVGHLDQLRRHPDSVACPAHAPFEQVLDVQPPADFRQLDILSAKQERRRPACHLQSRHLRERVDHFFSESVAEVFVLLVRAHVRERQHGNRRFVRRSARTSTRSTRVPGRPSPPPWSENVPVDWRPGIAGRSARARAAPDPIGTRRRRRTRERRTAVRGGRCRS